MPTLSDDRIAQLVEPFYPAVSQPLAAGLSVYLDLLLKWNGRTNLTAIRDPEEIVRRHFGESLFAARHIPPGAHSLLDLGSGAGFPGIPIQLVFPELLVTLAESQNKKAAFLLEAVRSLALTSKVHAQRAETLVGLKSFDTITMRAVDNPAAAEALASKLLAPGGMVLHLKTLAAVAPGEAIPIPGRENSFLHLYQT